MPRAETTAPIADGTVARTNAADHASGLVTGTSSLLSRSFELGMIKHNVLSENDAVSVVAAKPLTVFDGAPIGPPA